MVLVGNKEDLQDQREVSEEDLMAMGNSLKVKTMETSAKSAKNVSKCFHDLVREIRYDVCVVACDALVFTFFFKFFEILRD